MQVFRLQVHLKRSSSCVFSKSIFYSVNVIKKLLGSTLLLGIQGHIHNPVKLSDRNGLRNLDVIQGCEYASVI